MSENTKWWVGLPKELENDIEYEITLKHVKPE